VGNFILKSNKNLRLHGFTLIEVLIALAIISIGLSALMKATITSTRLTQILKEKIISHIVAMDGVAMIQLGLLDPAGGMVITKKTKMLNQYWYWRPEVTATTIQDLDLIQIKVSVKTTGPYKNSLYAFWYHPND